MFQKSIGYNCTLQLFNIYELYILIELIKSGLAHNGDKACRATYNQPILQTESAYSRDELKCDTLLAVAHSYIKRIDCGHKKRTLRRAKILLRNHFAMEKTTHINKIENREKKIV